MPRVILGTCLLETHPLRQPRFARTFIGGGNRGTVVVITHKSRRRKCLGHDQRGGAVPTPHIRHLGARLQFSHHTLQRR